MRVPLPIAALGLALALPAHGEDLRLTHQLRLLDALGEPRGGELPLTLALYPSATLGTALWSATYAPVAFADGYAAVELTVDDLGRGIDPAWFGAPVWLEVTVDGETLSPRTRIADLPAPPRAPARKRVLAHGAGFNRPDLTLDPLAIVGPRGVTFPGTGARDRELLHVVLADPGEYPNGALIEVLLGMRYITADADPYFRLIDRDPPVNAPREACGIQLLDQDLLYIVTGPEAELSADYQSSQASGTSPVDKTLRATFVLYGDQSTAGFVTAESHEMAISGPCATDISLSIHGLAFQVLQSEAGESFELNSLLITVEPL